ncbi:MAG TPA: GyrI-like domain-containing protein [Streptomyces sp.]|nr:GyrI-like domain-containing protein [Streptomyces sp.]
MTSSTSDSSAGAPEPELAVVDKAVTAVVRGVVPMEELRNFFDTSFRDLAEAVSAQQVAIAGPAFGLFHGPPQETADLEVGFVTDHPVRAQGDVVASSLPGTRVARLVHFGGFDGLGSSWERLDAWIREQGLSPGQLLWEFYLTEPSPDMDPDDLRTELNWSIAD